jgi:tetratricopeptide (TPR) repeat protein
MRPFLRSRPLLVALAIAVLATFAIGFVPLFDGPGYESALAAGVVLPILVAIATALELSTAPAPAPVDALGRGLANGAAFALAAYLVAFLHGLRVGFCDLRGGSVLFALGPGVGALLAGAWGAVAGEMARRRRRPWSRRLIAAAVAALAPLGAIGVSVARFYTSPMVFAYDPFAGYFSGSIYDTVIDPSGLLGYRAGSAATLLAAAILALHLVRRRDGRLAFRLAGRPGLLLLGAAALAASLASTALGSRLGHWQTPATIAAALGARTSGERCDVIYPRTMPRADAERFARECDAHLRLAERYFEAPGPGRVTAYLFADAGQKGALMGAGDTYIAKPWRREVYVQAGGYPHPALGHELIHVFAGAFGRGPFRVAGSFGGLLPDPGLIEGVAVAASPPEGDLLPREWAKAMKDLGLLPPLRNLFALGFFGENGATAYTVSGAFVGWVRERYGAAALRAWYGGAALTDVTGASLQDLEGAWHDDLDRATLPDAARAQAKARFDRPAIFGRRCPHVVDACKGRAEGLRAAGDEEGAIAAYREAMALDPGDAGLGIGVARSEVREGKPDEGRRALEGIADGTAARHVRDRALEDLGDLALARGDGAEAEARYREVAQRTVDEDQIRTLEVKTFAAHQERARPALVALLVGVRGYAPDRFLAAELLGRWAAEAPDDGLPQYLLARQYLNAGQYDEAAGRLDRALATHLPLPRVEIEAQRLRMVAACATGDAKAAAAMLAAYLAHPTVGAARSEAARTLVERCSPGAGAERG